MITNGTCIGCVSVESLAASVNSELKQITIPMPTSLITGNYYIGWLVDPYNEVVESDENNSFYLSSTQLTITRHHHIRSTHSISNYFYSWS